MLENSLFIKGLRVNHSLSEQEYYTDIPVIANLDSLAFKKPISFFVGENGSGKSTLLEAIAVSFGFNAEGGSVNYQFSTKTTHSNLFDQITLIKGAKRPKDSFFLRAESFYNVATYVEEMGLDVDGKSLHHQSHGESFLSLVNHRFRGKGIYILDEPEAALSPQKQLTLMIILNELVRDGSQFIIATHSPILLAMPNSSIFSFDDDEIREVDYEETNVFQITKMFMEDKSTIISKLFNEQ